MRICANCGDVSDEVEYSWECGAVLCRACSGHIDTGEINECDLETEDLDSLEVFEEDLRVLGRSA